MSFRFDLHATDSDSAARRATLHTPHGPVETPAFMPVGTQGAIKGVTIDQLRAIFQSSGCPAGQRTA